MPLLQKGVWEYWLVDPDKNRILVYDFEKEDTGDYTFSETVRSGIFEGLSIDFSDFDVWFFEGGSDMRTRKRFFIIAAILIIIIGISICITYFLHQKSDLDIEQVIHNYTTLQENINQVEQSYLDDNGYVSIDNKEVLLNEIENTISENKKSGVIKDYKREEEGIFADLGGVGYLYSPPIEDTMSYSSDNIGKTETVKKEILTVEPYSTQPGMLLIYGVSGLDSPDGVAKEIVSTFPDNYVFPDENRASIPLF